MLRTGATGGPVADGESGGRGAPCPWRWVVHALASARNDCYATMRSAKEVLTLQLVRDLRQLRVLR